MIKTNFSGIKKKKRIYRIFNKSDKFYLKFYMSLIIYILLKKNNKSLLY